jgi:hypothetical protein
MTFPSDPHQRVPRGDKNRRVALGIDCGAMAEAAGITVQQLHSYEFTQPDRAFSVTTARRVGTALERFEAMDARPKEKTRSTRAGVRLTLVSRRYVGVFRITLAKWRE